MNLFRYLHVRHLRKDPHKYAEYLRKTSGATIGSNVIIGAGSVVTKDIPSNSVAAGNPCKVLMNIEEYYAKNKGKIVQTKFMSASEKKAYLHKYYDCH